MREWTQHGRIVSVNLAENLKRLKKILDRKDDDNGEEKDT